MVICIPNYNGEKYLRNLKKIEGADILVMDNASTDGSVAVCKKKGFKVVENQENVDRTLNWIRCLEYFKSSSYEWMKWLFVGDELKSDLVDIVDKSITRYPEASLIVFNYEINNREKITLWKPYLNQGVYDSKIVATELMKGNNVFGSPIAIIISKKAVQHLNGIELHKFTWAADAYMGYLLSKGVKTAFVDDIIGRFNVNERKHYGELANSVWATLEELEMIRVIALENGDIDIGKHMEKTAVYHYFLKGFSVHPKKELIGHLIRKCICSKAGKKHNKVL